jgi:hypothetical protein
MPLSLPHKTHCFFTVVLFACVGSFVSAQSPDTPSPFALSPSSAIPSDTSPSDTNHERWDKLALRDNSLHPDPPIVGQTDAFPGFTRELVRVKWRSGDPIDLYIVRPEGVARPPVVLYMYGYPREAVRFLDPEFCRTVTRNGLAAVGFSSVLTGQRYHDVPMKVWFVSQLQQSLAGTVHDLQMTINYLEQRGDFDTTRIGVFGEGSGATIALLAASVDPRIGAVDLLNPWGDWSGWLRNSRIVPESERQSYLTPQFLESVAPFDPVSVLPALRGGPALRLQQTLWNSDATPAASRDRIAAALPPSAVLVQYKDEKEYLEKAGRNGKMLTWLAGALSQPRPVAATANTGELRKP